jgi:hypothetical protein
MIRILVSIAICAWAAPASAGPTRLSMQWVNGENIHLAGERGAINRRAEIKIDLDLQAGGKLRVADTGTSSEHNLYETYSTTEESSWTNTWKGTWATRGSTLELQLVLDARTCTRTKTATGAAPQTLPCANVSKQVQLTCTTEQITVDASAGAARKPTQHAAWRCTPAAAADLAETPSIWVLGKSTCLQTTGGRGGPLYQRCKP